MRTRRQPTEPAIILIWLFSFDFASRLADRSGWFADARFFVLGLCCAVMTVQGCWYLATARSETPRQREPERNGEGQSASRASEGETQRQ